MTVRCFLIVWLNFLCLCRHSVCVLASCCRYNIKKWPFPFSSHIRPWWKVLVLCHYWPYHLLDFPCPYHWRTQLHHSLLYRWASAARRPRLWQTSRSRGLRWPARLLRGEPSPLLLIASKCSPSAEVNPPIRVALRGIICAVLIQGKLFTWLKLFVRKSNTVAGIWLCCEEKRKKENSSKYSVFSAEASLICSYALKIKASLWYAGFWKSLGVVIHWM